MLLEVCVDSVESAINAENGGASRLELCSALSVGGLTPSVGLLQILKQYVKIPIMCMLRPRDGDFTYTPQEMEVILADLTALSNAGSDGFVFGALLNSGAIDSNSCSRVVTEAKSKPVTFHRAFDLVDDMKNALDMIISLGFHRVLTSGQKTTALEGCETISQLVQMAKERIVIMPGSGITTSNITQLVELTCAKEYHGSFSEVRRSVFKSGSSTIKMGNDDNSDKKVTTTANVRIAVDILKLLS